MEVVQVEVVWRWTLGGGGLGGGGLGGGGLGGGGLGGLAARFATSFSAHSAQSYLLRLAWNSAQSYLLRLAWNSE